MTKFDELKAFLCRHMRMAHIYQPVMLKTLLNNGGAASAREIAKAILVNDESQIEYYQQITHNMVGRVLRRRGLVTRDGPQYLLEGFAGLTASQIQELQQLCEERIQQYVT